VLGHLRDDPLPQHVERDVRGEGVTPEVLAELAQRAFQPAGAVEVGTDEPVPTGQPAADRRADGDLHAHEVPGEQSDDDVVCLQQLAVGAAGGRGDAVERGVDLVVVVGHDGQR
jgi:hypothetical protein